MDLLRNPKMEVCLDFESKMTFPSAYWLGSSQSIIALNLTFSLPNHAHAMCLSKTQMLTSIRLAINKFS